MACQDQSLHTCHGPPSRHGRDQAEQNPTFCLRCASHLVTSGHPGFQSNLDPTTLGKSASWALK